MAAKLKSRRTLTSLMHYKRLPTAYAVAKKGGLTTQSGRIADSRIQHLVAGRRRACELVTAMAICDALEVPIETLFEFEDHVPQYTASARAAA